MNKENMIKLNYIVENKLIITSLESMIEFVMNNDFSNNCSRDDCIITMTLSLLKSFQEKENGDVYEIITLEELKNKFRQPILSGLLINILNENNCNKIIIIDVI